METNTKTSFTRHSSIDDIFLDSFRKKQESQELLARGNLTDDELERVAQTIYETTFARIFDLDYSEETTFMNSQDYYGCSSGLDLLKTEVRSYFNGDLGASINFSLNRLTHPAIWFGLDNFLESRKGLYEMKEHLTNSGPGEIKAIFTQYLEEFEKHKDYLKSNLKIILDQDPNVENIKSILSTGHSLGNKLCYREVVLTGEKSDEALAYLRTQLNGEYTFVETTEGTFKTPEEGKIPVVILDRRPFEDIHHPFFERPGLYDSLLDRINILMRGRPDTKVLTMATDNNYEGVHGFYYTVSSETLISAQENIKSGGE
jgi:hypothetical protein